MKFSTTEIANKVFKKEFYGYCVEEVKSYLDGLSNHLNQILQERNSLKEQVRLYESQITEFKQNEQILRETITAATQMSERMKEEARLEAQKIISSSQEKSLQQSQEAAESLKKMYLELAELKKAKQNFENNLKALAKSHIDYIDQSAKSTAQTEIPVAVAKTEVAEKTSRAERSEEIKSSGFKVQPLDFA
jgi:cell division initiation protein